MARYITSIGDFDNAVKSAGDKMVVVDFTASWCGPCKMIAPQLESLAQEYASLGVFLKVDVDAYRPLVERFGVSGFPTFVFLRRSVEIERMVGADGTKLATLVQKCSVVPPPPEPASPFSFPLRQCLRLNKGNPAAAVAFLIKKKGEHELDTAKLTEMA
jgi:thioredoxin